MNCYLCNDPLTQKNNSGEHIIPNSIGGIREVKGFICRECNGKAGETWDSDLSKQLNQLALFFRVVRDRGENKSEVIETTSGEKLIYNKGSLKFYSPERNIEEKDDGVHINIKANDMKQARQILTGLKRTYPSLDVEELLSTAKPESIYPEGYMHLKLRFGGLEVGKSFVKTALALLSANGINPRICERANDFLLTNGEPCFGYYYYQDPLIDRPTNVPIHCICVKGNKTKRTIQAYLEYFGILRVVMSLSAEYEGEDFAVSYAIDPTKGIECPIDFDFSLDEVDIRRVYNYEFMDHQMVQDCFHAVVPNELQRQEDQHLTDVIEAASKEVQARFSGKSDFSTDEFVDAYMEKLLPYIEHQARRRNFSDDETE
ncbi:hypothetical protein SB18R_02810 [Pseudomonas oryzihabitans]|nr:hypothetical protein NS201_13960 [Pseudomonas psychrotolerans]KTT36620.1 hypothetical protein SB9_05910 [Pseudomonas psychrotolerans]KTT78454.1 hypothetical protein SB18R_02810 [Pseudomonas psychrotolerans]